MLFDNPNLLSNEEIREQLIQDGNSAELVDSIIQQFWIHDWGNSFISIKEHFNQLKKYLIQVKPKQFSRFDFYTFYFDSIPSFKKMSVPFQRVAIVFELMQTDRIETKNFNELLKELRLTKYLNLKFFIDAKLIFLEEKEGKQIATWAHHTLTEYLSATYILNQKDILQTVDKFMCSSETGVNTYIPSWLGTLRFLLEKKSEMFIHWLNVNLKTNPDFLNDKMAEVFAFDTPMNINDADKSTLFHLIYDSYQEKKWWIPVWAYHNLHKFVNKGIYKTLKDKVNDKEPYENRGNIAAVIDGMLQNNHPLLTSDEKSFWRAKLIVFANDKNPNGVLQRHALAALENFVGDDSIIESVGSNYQNNDSLVREAFLSLCQKVNPNSPISIAHFISGITEDSAHIYARNALYHITSAEGIKYFLTNASDNQKFVREFLDKESIFNDEKKQADRPILDNIRKNLNSETVTFIKKLIINSITGEKLYKSGDSYFLQQLALLVKSKVPNYLEQLIETIQSLKPEEKSRIFINNFEGILSVLLEPNKLEGLEKVFNDTIHHHAGYTLAEAIRLAPKNGNPLGNAVLKKGIELGITVNPETLPKYDNSIKERELEIYKQFKKYLSPPIKGRYFPEVFRYFTENQKIIEAQMNDSEMRRLLWLAIDVNLKKIDPKKIKVHYKDQESKSGEYTIDATIGYFGDVLRLIHKLEPKILQTPENRKKVINFIPFVYSNDLKIIQDILGSVNDEELSSLNSTMMNKNNDARYLIPQTYIYFTKIFPNLKSPKEVLISFVKDKQISDSDRDYALRTLEIYITSGDKKIEKFLLTVWDSKIRNPFSDTANALLISVFQNEAAIAWRFKTVKNNASPFHREEGAHSVGGLELELDNLSFAKPLIELKNEKYLDQFIGLLNFSLRLSKDDDYREYVNYLWRIAIAFVIRDDFLLSPNALNILKKWASGNKNSPHINWFNKRLEQARIEVSQNLKRFYDIRSAVKQL